MVSIQLLDSNQPKVLPKVSLLSQIIYAQNDYSNLESIVESEAKFEINNKADLLSELFYIKINKEQRQQKKHKQESQTNAAKHTKLLNKIFDYIYVAKCRRSFSLAWYNDLIYAQSKDSALKTLSIACYNSSNYKFRS